MYHVVTRKRPATEPPPADDEAKDRVIHTRVPGSLEAQLRERAEELGMSVSNLVRNVLGNAFGLVNNVVADGHAIARAARGEKKSAPTPAPPALEDVLGWQPIVLGKNALCARCNDLLPKGKDAAVGVGTQLVICPACLKELT